MNNLNALGSVIIGGGGNPNFATTLYAGNGGTQSIITGKNNAAGSLNWFKTRNTATNHYLTTTEKVNSYLVSNATNAETIQTQGITAYNSNGVTLGNWGGINNSGTSYVLWTFLEAAGFFDIVRYTGTGGSQNIAHNLGVTPGCIIVKSLPTGDWIVYHNSLNGGSFPQTQKILLNSTAAEVNAGGSWDNQAPSSSVFRVNGDTSVSGRSYIAYLFAHNPSKGIACDGFMTDGSGNATVNCGFRPQWLLYKRRLATGNWQIVDKQRGETAFLQANISSVESSIVGINFTSNGFTASGLNVVGANQSCIYIAIR